MQPERIASLSEVGPPPEPKRRTEWAELRVEELLSIPFVAEFVFRSVKTTDGRKQEEVADFLIFHHDAGILIEQKCQEDPGARSGQRAELWARKNARAAWKQLRRALTRPKDTPVRCDHPRQGRVEFRDGLPPIRLGVVIVEVFQPVDLSTEAERLPLDFWGVPISYLSVNDFLNLARELRSVPDLLDYLAARQLLPIADRLVVGDERTLFSFYLLNEGSFAGCMGRSDARIAVEAQQDRLRQSIGRKHEADQDAYLLEYVADALATRNPDLAVNLPPASGIAYDPADRRTNYREMQAALADLRLRERAALGQAFRGAMERLRGKNRGFNFMAARLDSKPEWVYVFGAARNIDRPDLVQGIANLMRGAMAFYEKRKCLVVVDRDGEGFEVCLSLPGFDPTPDEKELGTRFFGGLRVTTGPLPFVPEHRNT